MVYYMKYWITVRQETPDVKSFVVCGNSLSAPYLLKINTVRGGADRPSLRFEGLGWYNSKDCTSFFPEKMKEQAGQALYKMISFNMQRIIAKV